MNYNADRPITTEREDLLGRASFSANFGKTIYEYNANEGPFPLTMQDTMAKIYSEWLQTTDYMLAESLSFSFTKNDPQKQDYAYSEIWIPVKKG